jgi:hypothetical protein
MVPDVEVRGDWNVVDLLQGVNYIFDFISGIDPVIATVMLATLVATSAFLG